MSDTPLFVHLRTHSAYSLAESMLKVGPLVEAVRDHGQPAVAVTDSFNTFAALEFSEKAADMGIQPIIGAQVTLGDSRDEKGGEVALLVQNETGWQNLSRLISDALLDGGAASGRGSTSSGSSGAAAPGRIAEEPEGSELAGAAAPRGCLPSRPPTP